MKLSKLLASIFFILFSIESVASDPFRLITVEPAALPWNDIVIGVQDVGYAFDYFFIDSNLAADVGLTPNIEVKGVFEIDDNLSWTIGTHYLQFVGSSQLQSYIETQQPNVKSFSNNFSGFASFLGMSKYWNKSDVHLNFQYAAISGNSVENLLAAYAWTFSGIWHLVTELGYDFQNHQPRGSLGVVREGPTFGTRLGLTYVNINDPIFNYSGPIPVVDFYWSF